MIYYIIIGLLILILTFPRVLGTLIEVLIRIFFTSKLIKHVKVSKFSLIPSFQIDGLEIEIHSTRKNPQIILTWKNFHINIRWSKIFSLTRQIPQTPGSIERYIEFTFVDFHIECIGLRFKDFIGPSSSSTSSKSLDDQKPRSLHDVISSDSPNSSQIPLLSDRWNAVIKGRMKLYHYLTQSFASLIKVQFESNFDFDFTMTTHKAKVIGSCSKLTIYALPYHESSAIDGIVGAVDIKDGAMEIYQNAVSAMEYFGQVAQVRVDMHLPSGMQAVKMQFHGKDEAAVSIPAFLDFYQEYQNAEDDAIESKLARRLNTSGKMYDILMQLKHMKISLSDSRSSSICVMELDDATMQMQTFMTTISNQRYLRGLHRIIGPTFFPSSSAISPSPSNPIDRLTSSLEKILTMQVSSVRWPAYDTPHHLTTPAVAFVKNASMKKTLRVLNDGDFIDSEDMIMSADSVEFQRVSLQFLEWLIILQLTSASVPSSRFVHPKRSVMHGYNRLFMFSTSSSDMISSGLTADEDYDELIVITASNIDMARTVLPRETSSLIECKADLLQVHTSLYMQGLSTRFNLKLHPYDENMNSTNNSDKLSNTRTGMLWIMRGMKGSMTMGLKSQFHHMNMPHGMTMQLTSQPTRRHVTSHVDNVSTNPDHLSMSRSKSRHSFMFTNEIPLNPHRGCEILCTFMQSTAFDATWAEEDITSQLGEVEMYLSMGSMIKAQCSYHMIREMTRRVLGHMSRIKSMTMKVPIPIPPAIPDSINTTFMQRMRVKLSLGESTSSSSSDDIDMISLSMDMTLDDVEIVQSIQRQAYKWKKGEFLYNQWKEQPAFVNKDFFYESILLSTDRIRRQICKIKEFIVGISTLNHFGSAFEAMNTQYEAYKLAMAGLLSAPRSSSRHHHHHHVTEEVMLAEQSKLRPDPYILDVSFDTWLILMDGPYHGSYQRNMIEMRYDSFIMRLDASQRELDMYSTIAHLDYGLDKDDGKQSSDSHAYLMHCNAAGGIMDIRVKAYTVRCAGVELYTFRMRNYSIIGCFYSASLNDPRVAISSIFILLADPPSTFTLHHNNHNNDNPTDMMQIYIPTKKSSAPSKMYFNLEILCEDCSINADMHTSSYMDALGCAMKWYASSNRDASAPVIPPPPLLWWDSTRYCVHGCYALRINTLRIAYTLPPLSSANQHHTAGSKITLLTNITQYQLIIEKSSVESSCLDVDIDVEIIDKSKLTRRNNLSTTNPINKVLRLPGIVIILAHHRIDKSSIQSHHDVYLNPCLYDYPTDPYALFRSQPMSVQWNVEILCIDSVDRPISIHARLDILTLLMQAISTDTTSTTTNYNNKQSMSAKESLATPIGVPVSPIGIHGCNDLPIPMIDLSCLTIAATIVKQHLDAAVPLPPPAFSLADLLHTLDIQINIHEVMFHSWYSNSSFAGIVFSLRHLELQLLMNRNESLDNKNKSDSDTFQVLAIEDMFLQLDFAELYVRDWCVHDKTLEVVPSPALARRYYDPIPSMASSYRNNGTVDDSNSYRPHRPFSLSRSGATEVGMLSTIAQEPMRYEEIKEMMKPIYKLAHATKVEMSRTEHGDVSKKRSDTRILNLMMSHESINDKEIGIFSLKSSSNEIRLLLGQEKRRYKNDSSYHVMREKMMHEYHKHRILAQYNSIISPSPSPSSTPSSRHSKKRHDKKSSSKSRSSKKMMLSPISATTAAGSFRPKLTSFLSNHAALMPPYYALPQSYQGNRPLTSSHQHLASSKNHVHLHSPQQQHNRLSLSSSASTSCMQMNKIWGLRIIDMRLLWTLEIRDIIFNYVSRSFDVFAYDVVDPSSTSSADMMMNSMDDQVGEDNNINNNNDVIITRSRATSTASATSSIPVVDTKAILTDFRHIRTIKSKSNTNISDLQASQYRSPDNNNHLSGKHQPPVKLRPKSRSRKGRKSTDIPADPELAKFVSDGNSNHVVKFLDNNISPASAVSSSLLSLKSPSVDIILTPRSLASYTPSTSTPVPNSNRNSHNREPFIDSDLSPLLSSKANTPMTAATTSPASIDPLWEKKVQRGKSVHAKRSTVLNRNSLTNNSTEDTNLTVLDNHSPLSSKDRPFSNNSSHTNPNLSSSSPAVDTHVHPNPNSSMLSHRAFIVELIDPQINFLDMTTHSSMIIVAGRSSFEGYQDDAAFLTAERNTSPSSSSSSSTNPKRKSEFKLSMDGVSLFTATTSPSLSNTPISPTSPSMVEHDAVHWKIMDNTISHIPSAIASPSYQQKHRSSLFFSSTTSSSSTSSSTAGMMMPESPLRVAIKDFQIRARYVFWMDVMASEAHNMTVYVSSEELLCNFSLDLPEIIVDTDSTQFYITLNVIRNLLLVPPPPLPNLSSRTNNNTQTSAAVPTNDVSKYEKVLERYGIKYADSLPIIDITSRGMRDAIKGLVEEGSLSQLQDDASMARIVQVYIGKGVWLLRGSSSTSSSSNAAVGVNPPPTPASSTSSSSSPAMIVETGFTGVYATFTYHEDRSSSILLETQRFWARNHTESSSAMMMNNKAKDLHNTMSWIMMPVLLESEPCVRCGAIFNIESNNSSSCTFHADQDGYPGQFLDTLIYDDLTQSSIKTPMWTCCGRSQADAPGCNSRPHICKEVMISIRAETNPLIRIHNLDIQVFHALDITFFPGALYDLHVELSRGVIDMLHHFFSIEDQPDVTLSSDPVSSSVTSSSASSSTAMNPSSSSTAITSSNPTSSNDHHQEILYINYLRLGDINVDVSTSGFPLNIDNYHAVVEPFICRGEVLNWHRLIANMERHAIFSVSKNFASNIGNRIGNIILGTVSSNTRGSIVPSTMSSSASSTTSTAMPSKASSSSTSKSRFFNIPRSIAGSLLRSTGSGRAIGNEIDEEELAAKKRELLLGNQRRTANNNNHTISKK